ncbi:MAG: hypothetical protein NTV46_02510 [Verrucomicrobia bacterium]|nr:hypothetical protein [Verrucomicrobiota bacterium]
MVAIVSGCSIAGASCRTGASKHGGVKFNCVFRKDPPSLYPDTAFPGYPGPLAGIVTLLNVYFKNPAFHPKVLLLNAGLHDVGKKIAIDTRGKQADTGQRDHPAREKIALVRRRGCRQLPPRA